MPNVNTGEIERLQKDVNPNSPTFGQTRWVSGGRNLDLCPITPVFNSQAISETVYRVDCGTGISTGVVFTLPQGYISDTTSQYDVDARARDAYDVQGPAYALAHATCNGAPSKPTVRIAGREYVGKKFNVELERSISNGTLEVTVTMHFVNGDMRTGTGTFVDGYATAYAQVFYAEPGSGPMPTEPAVESIFISSTSPATYDIIN